ncbi:MAG: hypothetical protein ACRECO_07555 [Xanthobacteraceae bacterium]
MATIRILATVGAALIAGLLTIHAPAQARAGAPLSLLPTDQPASGATRTAPASKAIERATAKKRAAKKSTTTKKKKKKRAATKRTTTRKSTRRNARRPSAKVEVAEQKDNVMRGADSISLIARLPWWRNDGMQTIRYSRGAELESKMLAAADAWVAQHEPSGFDIARGNDRLAKAEIIAAHIADEAGEFEIADAGEINRIDLALDQSEPPQQTFLQSLIALLGGAVAAASAARFLFG